MAYSGLKEAATSVTLRKALQAAAAYLAERGIEDAQVDAWLLMEYVTGLDRTHFLMERNQVMGVGSAETYWRLLEKRGRHIPLQHLTGTQEFMGLSFQVNGHVLIPRQDTEILVEQALERLGPGMRVLDLCTGSGCIAVSLDRLGRGKLRKQAETRQAQGADRDSEDLLQVDASDVSQMALAVAAANIRRLDARVNLICSDLFENISGYYDMIVSNPPYIPTDVIHGLDEEVRCHEPLLALDGSADGLRFYREIIRESRKHLAPGGWLLFEIGYDQGSQVKSLMEDAGFGDLAVAQDLAGLDRVVQGRRQI